MCIAVLNLLRALACALVLALPHAAMAGAGRIPSVMAATPAAAPASADEPKEKSCKQGKRTKAFGWLLVDYGLSTAKYVVGLFLIPVGLLLVCIGAVVQVVEAVACG